VVSVLPDVPAIDRVFDYSVPPHLDDRAVLGAVVRVPLHGRRVRGWIVDVDAVPPDGVALRELTKVSGLGPAAEVLDLAAWAAWRWAGRRAGFLRTASPDRVVPGLPAPALGVAPSSAPDPLAAGLLAEGGGVLRLPPAASRYPVAVAVVAEAARRGGSALVLVASVAQAAQLARRLRAEGVPVALQPDDWARARAGAVVVGTRAAAWAPAADLAAVVLFDEHDEVWQEERAPTWHARDVLRERARRAGAPFLVVSPAPTLEALAVGPVVAPDRVVERAGWPLLEVVDRRDDDPTTGLFSEVLVRRLSAAGRAVCVLNRTGRARLLACGRCRDLARCDVCEAAVRQDAEGRLVCPRCGAERPVVCTSCGSTRLRLLRIGVTRAREELSALLGEPVAEVTGASDTGTPTERVVIGTEAVLHRIGRADLVAFLEMDQELLAPRYRAAEEALALLVRAGRMVGPRSAGGRIVVQTSVPRHEVLDAVEHGDPERVAAVEQARRVVMRFPPELVLAEVSGAAAEAFVAALPPVDDLEVLGPDRGHWLLRAPDHAVLADVLAATPRPPGRLRVAVDPLRI
jgi:primosomal protein N' (replication factor Y)